MPKLSRPKLLTVMFLTDYSVAGVSKLMGDKGIRLPRLAPSPSIYI